MHARVAIHSKVSCVIVEVEIKPQRQARHRVKTSEQILSPVSPSQNRPIAIVAVPPDLTKPRSSRLIGAIRSVHAISASLSSIEPVTCRGMLQYEDSRTPLSGFLLGDCRGAAHCSFGAGATA